MSHLNDLTALLLPTGSRLAADETPSHLSLSLEGQPLIALRFSGINGEQRYPHAGPTLCGSAPARHGS